MHCMYCTCVDAHMCAYTHVVTAIFYNFMCFRYSDNTACACVRTVCAVCMACTVCTVITVCTIRTDKTNSSWIGGSGRGCTVYSLLGMGRWGERLAFKGHRCRPQRGLGGNPQRVPVKVTDYEQRTQMIGTPKNQDLTCNLWAKPAFKLSN